MKGVEICRCKFFAMHFYYRKITIERPLRMSFQLNADLIKDLDQDKNFIKLPIDQQASLEISLAKTDDGQCYNSAEDFRAALNEKAELAKAKKIEWRHFSVTGPILVAVGEPNKKDRKEAMFAQVERDNAHRYPRLYDEYNKHGSEVINAGKPVISLAADSIENKATIDKFLTKVNRPATDFLVLPISSELAEMTAIIDAKTGDFIEIVDAKPKPISHKK